MQGTKVLEDREIRHSFCSVSEGTPPQQVLHTIAKYTGSLVAPEWEDVEKGRLFDFLIPCENAQSQEDKFETLCHVKADVSTAPCTSSFATGTMGYRRGYDVILLVGLTELKAQISWIDSNTVRTHPVLCIHLPHTTSMRMNLGDGEEVRSNVLRVPPPQAEFNFQERCCGRL